MDNASQSHDARRYVGNELDTFAHAWNWKSYWAGILRRYIGGEVLEIGAGIGANTAQLYNTQVRSMHCLEPDETLAARLREAVCRLPAIKVSVGTIASLSGRQFDSIVYVDVLEHIRDDRLELMKGASLLRPGGRLIVLAPAHQALFSPFDQAIGHYRRYNKRTLRLCSPPSCALKEIRYLDSVGLLASAANRVLLGESQPSLRQILFWDRYMVPLSKALDWLLGYRIGRSILAVWVAELSSA